MEDVDKQVIITKETLIAYGYFIEVPGGIRITKKGYTAAYDLWMAHSDEEKLLLSGLLHWMQVHKGELPPE